MNIPFIPGQKLNRVKEKNPVNGWLSEQLQYIKDLDYAKHKLHRVEYKAWYDKEGPHINFSSLSDIKMDKNNAREISRFGSLRWCIENEGFNIQKNGGYNLEHNFSRKKTGAKKNYYELLQMAHLVNQLGEKLLHMKEQPDG